MARREFYLYPPGSETEEDLIKIRAAHQLLRQYGRRFENILLSKQLQLKGIFSIFSQLLLNRQGLILPII